jgi:hypothetical protein
MSNSKQYSLPIIEANFEIHPIIVNINKINTISSTMKSN